MIKVGNNIVLVSEILLVPHGETAEIICDITPTDQLHCLFSFLEDAPEVPDKTPYVSCDWADDIFTITFKNFNKPMGATTKPINFALSNNREPLFLIASVYKYKAITKAEIQITMSNIPISLEELQ